VFIMSTSRILDSRPKYTVPDWYKLRYLPEILGTNLPPGRAYQTLKRCLDRLTDDVQMKVEIALAARANIVEIVDERKPDLVSGFRTDRHLKALAIDTSLESFGRGFMGTMRIHFSRRQYQCGEFTRESAINVQAHETTT